MKESLPKLEGIRVANIQATHGVKTMRRLIILLPVWG